MGDWDWGYERGLWGADGIPYDTFGKKSRYVKPRKISNENDLKVKELLLVREKIKTLKTEEQKLKEQLKELIPPFGYMDVSYSHDGENFQYILQRKCHKKPQRLKSLMYTEQYIRQTYGDEIAYDILLNCTKQKMPVDTIYVFKKSVNNNNANKNDDSCPDWDDDPFSEWDDVIF